MLNVDQDTDAALELPLRQSGQIDVPYRAWSRRGDVAIPYYERRRQHGDSFRDATPPGTKVPACDSDPYPLWGTTPDRRTND